MCEGKNARGVAGGNTTYDVCPMQRNFLSAKSKPIKKDPRTNVGKPLAAQRAHATDFRRHKQIAAAVASMASQAVLLTTAPRSNVTER